jgi:hypothetical protein
MMRLTMLFVAIVGLATAGRSAIGVDAPRAAAARQEGVTLMGTLAEWMYPGAAMPQGATMSDGGNPTTQSVKLQAVLTTVDPIEKVIVFYEKKLEGPGAAESQPDTHEELGAAAKSVTRQDDSQGRPVAIRIFVVNTAATSTTLVISRSEGEKETHIAWLHYLRFDVRK